MCARFAVEFAGLVRKAHGKLTLTNAGAKLIAANNRYEIFTRFFSAFVGKYQWAYNDRFPQNVVGQLGWGLTVYALHLFGDVERPLTFYLQKYISGFRFMARGAEAVSPAPEQYFSNSYIVRTLERFLLWFGFVAVNSGAAYFSKEDDTCVKTALLGKVFAFKEV